MARRKRERTQIEKEYYKQRKRVQQYISRATKRGIMIAKELPTIPKKITEASIRKLQSITPTSLKSKAKYVDTTTGEILTRKEYQKRQKEEANRKRQETRLKNKQQKELEQYKKEIEDAIRRNTEELNQRYQRQAKQREEYIPTSTDLVLQNWDNEIARYPSMLYPRLKQWTNDLISQVGRDAVAEMITTGYENGLIISYSIAYDESKIMEFITDMMDYLPNIGDYISSEEMAQLVDELGDWEEY